jgi:pepF/M3 family oligoendopeptidase
MNAKAPAAPRWDLDRIYPGGVTAPAWRDELAALNVDLTALIAQGQALGPADGGPAWGAFLEAAAALDERRRQLTAFAWLAASVAAQDPACVAAIGEVEAAASRAELAWTAPEAALAAADDASWAALLATPAGAAQADGLRWRRIAAKARPPAAQQQVVVALSDAALHAWGRRYSRAAAKVVVELGGERLSHGQAFNRLSDPDPAVRRAAQAGITAGWRAVGEDCAEALDQIIGSRAALAALAGRAPLDEALDHNRLSRPTLDALLAACAAGRPALWRALQLRARLLGVSTVDWADLSAPVDQVDMDVPWDEAERTVRRCFAAQGEAMGAFAARAFDGGWIEAEDRGGKRHGAFCIGLPRERESRVFMTYSGRMTNLVTLAHELGHAYHNDVLMGEPAASRSLPYTLAETASTFAEAVVRGEALDRAAGRPEELGLIDQELQSAIVMLLNIPMRFALEQALFEMKAEGPLSPDRLCAQTEALQRAAYGPVLGEAHPMFWAEKLHFYLTRAPFYNFPYAFGYFFSALVFARAREEGPAFAPRYAALLADTGRCTVEEVAARHLGVDLTDPAAWAPVIADIERLVERYAALVEARG